MDTFGDSNNGSTTAGGGANTKILQPYLEAAKTCQNVAAMRAIVSKVVQDPELFAGYDQVKSVLQASMISQSRAKEASSSEEAIFSTLDLFSYGTLVTYHASSSGHYMTLTDSQIAKLRQLTILTLIEQACMKKQDKVTYAAILEAIQSPSNPSSAATMEGDHPKLHQWREIEFILAQLLGANLFTGKLSQKNAALILKNPSTRDGTPGIVCARDVHPSTVAEFMLPALRALSSKIAESNEKIQKQQAQALRAMEDEKNAMKRLVHTEAESGMPNHAAAAEGGDMRGSNAMGAHFHGGHRPKRSRGGLVGNNNLVPPGFGQDGGNQASREERL